MNQVLKEITLFRPKLKTCWKVKKPSYTKRSAQEAKNRRWSTDHVRLRVYQCDFCNHWHLTSKL